MTHRIRRTRTSKEETYWKSCIFCLSYLFKYLQRHTYYMVYFLVFLLFSIKNFFTERMFTISTANNYSVLLRNISWIPWNLSGHYILLHEKRLQTMPWHHKAKVNSHQRWKQTRFRVCFHLWCELTSTMNVTE